MALGYASSNLSMMKTRAAPTTKTLQQMFLPRQHAGHVSGFNEQFHKAGDTLTDTHNIRPNEMLNVRYGGSPPMMQRV